MKNDLSKVDTAYVQFPVSEIGRAMKVFQQFYCLVKCFWKRAKIKHTIIKTNDTFTRHRVRNQLLNLNVYAQNSINIKLKYWNVFLQINLTLRPNNCRWNRFGVFLIEQYIMNCTYLNFDASHALYLVINKSQFRNKLDAKN